MKTNDSGQLLVTVVNGLTWTGLYAPDGSVYVCPSDGRGAYHKCGAMNYTEATAGTRGLYAPDGSFYLSTANGTGIYDTTGALRAYGLYDIAAVNVFNAFTTPPTTARKILIDTCVKALKTAGVWAVLDALYLLAAADQQASRVNWKNPANSLTAVNAPTFSANLGWTFASTKSLSTGYDFSAGVAGAKYASANAHIFTFATTDSTADARSDLGSETVGSAFINSRTAAGLIFGRLNFGTGGDAFGAVPTSVGMTLINRTNDTNAQYCRDGSVVYDRAIASGAVPGNLVIGNATSSGTQPSPRRLAAAGFGGGLNIGQLPAYYNAVYGYLHSVGAV